MQDKCSPTRRCYLLVALFLGVMFGFAVYRHSSFVVWNDTCALYHPYDADDRIHLGEVHDRFRNDPWNTLWTNCVEWSFSETSPDGYRPLSMLWLSLAAALFYTPTHLPFPLLLVVGAWLGALAVSVFYVARRFVQSDLTALGAVLLVMASPPLVGASWVCVAGVQCLVPLLSCVSFLCYWNFNEGRHRVFCATCLVLLLLLGPWVREFFGLNALLLIFLEFRRAKRPTWIMGTAALGFLHAVFPTALIHWLFHTNLPLAPVYRLGSLSGELGKGYIRWNATWHFLPLFPPSLWVCAVLETLLLFRIRCASAEGPREERTWNIDNLIAKLVLPSWLLMVLTLSAFEWNYHDYWGLALALLLAALALSRDSFLGCWFLLMYLPILRVFTENVHFLYAMPPAAIILAGSMESLWLRLGNWRALAWVRVPLACVFAVIGVDQALNIKAARIVNRAIYGGIDVVGDWFVRHVPERSAVVTNVIHGLDLKWHSGNHVDLYWTITSGLPGTYAPRFVDQPFQLEELLAHSDSRKVYFLDVDFDYTPDKISYHRHKYVHQAVIDWRDLGEIHFTHACVRFVDPLRYLIPRTYQPFLGAPDLENDFARKCSGDYRFRHEVYASYHVYEVTGRRVIPKLEGPIQLVQQGLEGFNIVRVGLGFHAVPQDEGVFDIDRFQRHKYSRQFSGLTLESVRKQVRASVRRGGEEEPASQDKLKDG